MLLWTSSSNSTAYKYPVYCTCQCSSTRGSQKPHTRSCTPRHPRPVTHSGTAGSSRLRTRWTCMHPTRRSRLQPWVNCTRLQGSNRRSTLRHYYPAGLRTPQVSLAASLQHRCTRPDWTHSQRWRSFLGQCSGRMYNRCGPRMTRSSWVGPGMSESRPARARTQCCPMWH